MFFFLEDLKLDYEEYDGYNFGEQYALNARG